MPVRPSMDLGTSPRIAWNPPVAYRRPAEPAAGGPPPAEPFAGHSKDKLRLAARRLARQGEYGGAIARWGARLGRDLKPEERLEGLVGLGIALKDGGRYEEAAATFRRVLASEADEVQTGCTARLQRAHTLQRMGEPREALREARAVARSDVAAWITKAQGRWLDVESMVDVGDQDGTIAEMESMLRDYESDTRLGFLVKRAEERLARFR